MFQIPSKRVHLDSSSPSFKRDHCLNSIIATSAIALSQKRRYGEDYTPFCRSYQPRNVGFQVAKAAIIQSSMAVLEYNVYLERAIASEVEIEDFDFKAARIKYTAAFMTLAKRNLSISILKHFYELLAVVTLSNKAADRFSKNLLKSITRKLTRYSRATACGRIFRTAIWTNIPFNCATLTVDIVFNFADYLYSKKTVNKKEVVLWLGRKVTYFSVCTISSAAGYAFGCYFNPNSLATYSACIFEAIFAHLITMIIGM